MYILTADQCSKLFSNNTSQGIMTGGGAMSPYDGVQRHMASRVEEALEIDSLALGEYTDRFRLAVGTERLRLRGAFLVNGSVTVTGANLEHVDYVKGVVTVSGASGMCTVTYQQGFDVDTDGVYQGTPEWLQSIAKSALHLQYRLTTMVSANSDNVSYGELLQEVRRDLAARIYKRWMRERVDVLIYDESERHG